MSRAVGRIVSTLITAGGWLVAGARAVLDLIGYSTLPQDVQVAQAQITRVLGWLLSLPWWVPVGFALFATLWLIWVSWPRQIVRSADSSPADWQPPQIVINNPPAMPHEPPATHQQHVYAYAHVDLRGVFTIDDSFNISSVSDDGAGCLTVAFAEPLNVNTLSVLPIADTAPFSVVSVTPRWVSLKFDETAKIIRVRFDSVELP